MQKQFTYIYNNEEVSREDFEKLAGDSFKWFDKDSIVSVPFSSFDNFFNGDFKSRRQVNDHLDSVLNIYQNKVAEGIINKPKCSPQCYCDGSCKKPQEKNLGWYKIPNVKVNATRHKAREEGSFHKEIIGDLEGINRPPSTYNGLEKYIASLKQLKDDTITNSNRGEKETMEHLQGVKETEGKLNYELDWGFIQQMAERMSQNKGKYEPYNWKRPMEVEKLKQSLFRHVIEIMKGNYSDDGRDFGHFESVALNSMMINYQLKNNV